MEKIKSMFSGMFGNYDKTVPKTEDVPEITPDPDFENVIADIGSVDKADELFEKELNIDEQRRQEQDEKNRINKLN